MLYLFGFSSLRHQDYSYWTRTKPMQHITVHVALDDQTVETGGLHYIPGSHRWHRNGMPLPITDASFGKMTSIEEVLTDEERENFKPVPSNLKRGEASFHHPLMVHGSYANRCEGLNIVLLAIQHDLALDIAAYT